MNKRITIAVMIAAALVVALIMPTCAFAATTYYSSSGSSGYQYPGSNYYSSGSGSTYYYKSNSSGDLLTTIAEGRTRIPEARLITITQVTPGTMVVVHTRLRDPVRLQPPSTDSYTGADPGTDTSARAQSYAGTYCRRTEDGKSDQSGKSESGTCAPPFR